MNQFSTIPYSVESEEARNQYIKERLSIIPNADIQFCSVFRTRLDEYRLVMAAEVDCLLTRDTTHGPQYVEIKTNKQLVQPRDKENFLK